MSLSEGEESSDEEFSEAESNSEEERELRAENKARREEAAKAKIDLDLAEKAKRKGRKRKSLTITSQVSMAPLVTEPGNGGQRPQTQTSKKTKRAASAAGPLVSTPGAPVTLEAITASMGAALSSGMSATMTQMIEQQQKQHEQMRAYVVPKKAQEMAAGDDEDNYEEEDTIMVDESVQLRDNSVDVLDYAVRSKLRVPNSSADIWWGKSSVSQRVCRPVRGSSLYLENIQGATRPNDGICKKVSVLQDYHC